MILTCLKEKCLCLGDTNNAHYALPNNFDIVPLTLTEPVDENAKYAAEIAVNAWKTNMYTLAFQS